MTGEWFVWRDLGVGHTRPWQILERTSSPEEDELVAEHLIRVDAELICQLHNEYLAALDDEPRPLIPLPTTTAAGGAVSEPQCTCARERVSDEQGEVLLLNPLCPTHGDVRDHGAVK